jgi:uncharacterized protein YaaR (DUF327 family)
LQNKNREISLMDKIDLSQYLFNPDPRLKKEKKSNRVSSGKKGSIKKTEDNKADNEFSVLLDKPIENETPANLEVIEDLLRDIGLSGERLKKKRDFNELEQYKKLVSKLIKDVIQVSITSENKTLWNSKRKEKVTKVHITVLNNELLELTRIFFEEQKNTLAIAAKIDKIEGMLIDMVS